MTTRTTALEIALSKAADEAAAKRTKKQAKPAPVVEAAAAVTTDVPVAETLPETPRAYDSRVDELLDLKAQIKAAEAKAKPIEALLRELAKSGEVEGERGIARLVTADYKTSAGETKTSTWFQVVSRKA
jgi:hypothetical protein